jgi:hypothetical protein
MLIHQNNPMQSSMAAAVIRRSNLTRRANQRHFFIIPQSCKHRRAAPASGRVGTIAAQILTHN